MEAQDIAKRQDKSDASRRKLVELSREFKKTSSEVLSQNHITNSVTLLVY